MPILEDLYQRQRDRQVELVPFFYSARWIGSILVAGANLAQNIQVQSDSHFLARYATITLYTAGEVVALATAPILANIFDTGSGRALTDQPQSIQNIFGGAAAAAGMGSLPFIYPEPWLIRASGVAQITLNNIGVTTYTTAIVSLIGMKVFKFGGGVPGDL